MSTAERTVAFVGPASSGKKTLAGNLIYQCGLDLRHMGLLEKNGIKKYEHILPFFKEKDISPTFYTRHGLMRITESSDPDLVVVVVDANTPNFDNWVDIQIDQQSLEIIRMAQFVIIAINKMDLIDWSEETFLTIAESVKQLLVTAIQPNGRILIVPTAAATASADNNILVPSNRLPWYAALASKPDRAEFYNTLMDCMHEAYA